MVLYVKTGITIYNSSVSLAFFTTVLSIQKSAPLAAVVLEITSLMLKHLFDFFSQVKLREILETALTMSDICKV